MNSNLLLLNRINRLCLFPEIIIIIIIIIGNSYRTLLELLACHIYFDLYA